MRKSTGLRRFLRLVLMGLVWILAANTALSAATSGLHINEVLFNPAAGGYQWVELKNSGAAPVNVAGYRVTNETGAWYTIPQALPAVPSGAFVMVIFDGAGSGGDDYNFNDKVATLHTGPGLVNILGRTTGQCALYDAGAFKMFLPSIRNRSLGTGLTTFSPPSDFLPSFATPSSAGNAAAKDPAPILSKTGLWSQRKLKSLARDVAGKLASAGPAILSFVAWGGAPENLAANASAAGLWSPRWFKSLIRGLGVGNPSTVPNESIGLLPGSSKGFPDDWTLYQVGEVTKGGENAVPGISFFYPPAGGTLDGATFSIIWAPVANATSYKFQMDNNSDFSSPEVNLTLTDALYLPVAAVAEGTYYWRVKVLLGGRESPWSSGVQVNSLTLPISLTLSDGMLGATAYKFITPRITWKLQHKDTTMLCLDGCPLTPLSKAWDRPHTTRGVHGNNYCARASMSMLISFYGGNVSQDRLSYEIFKGSAPEGELGHDQPTANGQQHTDTLAKFLGIVIPMQTGKPTFAQMKAWIDANQPFLTRYENSDGSGHLRVTDGYMEFTRNSTNYQFIHLLDPWDRPKWVRYSTDNVTHFWVGPAGPNGAPNVKSDEADIGKDTDHDGINDFDETYRFKTDLLNPDSDHDLVNDQQEIKDYIFNAGIFDPQDADTDWDTNRKEIDPDNDGGGMLDGCENIDRTDNFNPADDRIGAPTLNSPSGTVYTSTPTYKWNALCGAQFYWLLVDDSSGRGKIFQVFSAAEAGCPAYTGTCSVTPSTSLANGNVTWWVDACHWRGCGPWSNALGFVVSGGATDPIVGLWDTGEGGQALMEERTSGAYKFVAKVTRQGTWWTSRGITVGEEVWMLNKDPDGRYRGQVLVKGNFYWYMPFDVKIQGNQMIDNTNKLIATKVQ